MASELLRTRDLASAISTHGRMGLASRLSNPKYNMTSDYKKLCGYNNHLRTSYLLNPSYESTRLLAGHPVKGGGFYVPRLLLLMERSEWRALRTRLAAALDAKDAKPSAEQVFAPKYLT